MDDHDHDTDEGQHEPFCRNCGSLGRTLTPCAACREDYCSKCLRTETPIPLCPECVRKIRANSTATKRRQQWRLRRKYRRLKERMAEMKAELMAESDETED